jgi:hypothetical protein
MSLFPVVSQWTVLLGGLEAFEGGRAKEEDWGVEKQDLDAAPRQRTCSLVGPHPWIFGEARDNCGLFFVPKVEIHSERSPISDYRRARRKFATGPTCYPAKRIPELGKMEAVCRQWRGVLWRRQVFLSCKLINKCFKKKVQFLFGQTTYICIFARTLS